MRKKRSAPRGTAPKPFVFVLMPFSQEFSDIYTFGIRGAAEDAGAYAERVDEQIFTEGILDRIFNQINKADVLVADMTDRNANVFYEVGYAHALGKVVLLLTQKVDDIPFDLKHRPHIVYGGKIGDLRGELAKRITWAIAESKNLAPQVEQISAYYNGQRLLDMTHGGEVTVAASEDMDVTVNIDIFNETPFLFPGSSYLYVLAEQGAVAVPGKFVTYKQTTGKSSLALGGLGGGREYDASMYVALQPIMLPPSQAAVNEALPVLYRLANVIPQLPPGAVEQLSIPFRRTNQAPGTQVSQYRLRIHVGPRQYEFGFRVEFGK